MAEAGLTDGCHPQFVAKPYTKQALLAAVAAAWSDVSASRAPHETG